jgi:hypothetical protein
MAFSLVRGSPLQLRKDRSAASRGVMMRRGLDALGIAFAGSESSAPRAPHA